MPDRTADVAPQPKASKPIATKPSGAKPSGTKPIATEPVATKPGAAAPGTLPRWVKGLGPLLLLALLVAAFITITSSFAGGRPPVGSIMSVPYSPLWMCRFRGTV